MNKEKETSESTTEVKESKTSIKEKTVKVKTGVVANCDQLNVRNTPKQEPGNIVTNIPKGTELTIEEELGDFCKVTTSTGLHGFCMTEFIDKK